jgi:hypothetical protein
VQFAFNFFTKSRSFDWFDLLRWFNWLDERKPWERPRAIQNIFRLFLGINPPGKSTSQPIHQLTDFLMTALMTLGGSLFGELVDNIDWLGNPFFCVEDFYRDDVPFIIFHAILIWH